MASWFKIIIALLMTLGLCFICAEFDRCYSRNQPISLQHYYHTKYVLLAPYNTLAWWLTSHETLSPLIDFFSLPSNRKETDEFVSNFISHHVSYLNVKDENHELGFPFRLLLKGDEVIHAAVMKLEAFDSIKDYRKWRDRKRFIVSLCFYSELSLEIEDNSVTIPPEGIVFDPTNIHTLTNRASVSACFLVASLRPTSNEWGVALFQKMNEWCQH